MLGRGATQMPRRHLRLTRKGKRGLRRSQVQRLPVAATCRPLTLAETGQWRCQTAPWSQSPMRIAAAIQSRPHCGSGRTQAWLCTLTSMLTRLHTFVISAVTCQTISHPLMPLDEYGTTLTLRSHAALRPCGAGRPVAAPPATGRDVAGREAGTGGGQGVLVQEHA